MSAWDKICYRRWWWLWAPIALIAIITFHFPSCFTLEKRKAFFFFFFFRGVASSGSLCVNDDGMGLVQVVASFPLSFFYVIFFIKASRLPWWSNTTNVELWTYIERKKTEKENIKHKSLFYYFLSLLNCNWIERARVVQCGHDPNRWSWFSPVLVPHWNW